MVRLVTAFVDRPKILVMCDQRDCDQHASVEVPDVAAANQATNDFIRFLVQNGWAISLTLNLCAGHVAALQKMQKMVSLVPAGAIPGNGKSIVS